MNNQIYTSHSQWKKEGKYHLGSVESPNGPSMMALLIEWGRESVQFALRELAVSADIAIVDDDDEPSFLKEKYAYSLAWHYHCLQVGTRLDALINTVKDRRKYSEGLNERIIASNEKTIQLLLEFSDLQEYLVEYRSDANFLLPMDRLKRKFENGNMAPLAIRNLSKALVAEYSREQFLDGILLTLEKLPLATRSIISPEDYFPKPGQRIQLMDACRLLNSTEY